MQSQLLSLPNCLQEQLDRMGGELPYISFTTSIAYLWWFWTIWISTGFELPKQFAKEMCLNATINSGMNNKTHLQLRGVGAQSIGSIAELSRK
jgi:hypothetical protein